MAEANRNWIFGQICHCEFLEVHTWLQRDFDNTPNHRLRFLGQHSAEQKSLIRLASPMRYCSSPPSVSPPLRCAFISNFEALIIKSA